GARCKHRGNPVVQVFNGVVKARDLIFSFGFERDKPSLKGCFAGKIQPIKLLQDRIDLIKNHLYGGLVSVQATLNGFPSPGCQMVASCPQCLCGEIPSVRCLNANSEPRTPFRIPHSPSPVHSRDFQKILSVSALLELLSEGNEFVAGDEPLLISYLFRA